jgi:hypothetical protein
MKKTGIITAFALCVLWSGCSNYYHDMLKPLPQWRMSADQEGVHRFSPGTEGDGPPEAWKVTLANTGNQGTGELKLTLAGANPGEFTLEPEAIANIAPGKSAVIAARPRSGLAAGTYYGEITVSGDQRLGVWQFTMSYTVNPRSPLGTAAMPAASPPGGTYDGPQTVTLASGTAGAAVYYTLDGTDPAAGNLSSVPITVNMGKTLKAMAKKEGLADSPVMTAVYIQRTYRIAYVLNGGNWSGGAPVTEYAAGTAVTLAQNIVHSGGYAFRDWYGAEDFSGGAVTGVSLDGDKTYYARWEGDAGVTIQWSGPGDKDLALGDPAELSWAANTLLTLTAAGSWDAYAWALDGQTLGGETGNTLTRRARDLSPGRHRVTVTVTRGTQTYSNTITLQVRAD